MPPKRMPRMVVDEVESEICEGMFCVTFQAGDDHYRFCFTPHAFLQVRERNKRLLDEFFASHGTAKL